MAGGRDVERVRLIRGELGVSLGVISDRHFDFVNGALGSLGVIHGVIKNQFVVALECLGQRLHMTILGNVRERKHVRLIGTSDKRFGLYK